MPEAHEGVQRVVNNIEVLQPLRTDDRIRLAVFYRAIFAQRSVSTRCARSPIHIIVKNGM